MSTKNNQIYADYLVASNTNRMKLEDLADMYNMDMDAIHRVVMGIEVVPSEKIKDKMEKNLAQNFPSFSTQECRMYADYMVSANIEKMSNRALTLKMRGIHKATPEKIREMEKNIKNGYFGRKKTRLESAYVEALWETKYKKWYEAIPKNRKKENVIALRKMIHAMRADKIKPFTISKLLQKDNSTILHHLVGQE